MHSDNVFVAGLSLTTVGNLATPDIARDLMMEVDRHLRGGRPYLVKKVKKLKRDRVLTEPGRGWIGLGLPLGVTARLPFFFLYWSGCPSELGLLGGYAMLLIVGT